MNLLDGVKADATLSLCGQYRYALYRDWFPKDKGHVLWITARQLDYWVTLGVITPSVHRGVGSGAHHRWSAEDVYRIRIVALLMAWNAWEGRDALTSVARRVTQELDEMPADGGWLVVGPTGSVSWAAHGTELAEACRRNGPGCWVVDLGALAATERRAS